MNTPIVAPSSSGTMPSISNTPIISSTSSISNSSGLLSSDSSSSILNESESFLRSPIFIGIMIIIGLAVVGINVFVYLGSTTDIIASKIVPSIETITGDLSWFVNKFTDYTEEGTKGLVDVAGDTIKTTASIPNRLVKGAVVSSQDKKNIGTTSAPSAGSTKTTEVSQNNLQNKINNSNVTSSQPSQPVPDENSYSTKSGGSGFCYIGEDNGTRSCISVADSSKCMSGDVYSTLEQCQNA